VHPLRAAVGAAMLALATGAASAATPGFFEDFNNGTVDPFYSGASLVWVPSGGVGGAGDGYIRASRTSPGNLGLASADAPFVGDLTADGVTGISFWLNDVGNANPLAIHVGIGRAFGNFWLTRNPIFPPHNAWQEYTILFNNPADWVQIAGSGTFNEALTQVDRLLFRHDLAPYTMTPDAIAGDFGFDRIRVLPEPASGTLLLCALALRRRRRA